jgi:hypothetical protein
VFAVTAANDSKAGPGRVERPISRTRTQHCSGVRQNSKDANCEHFQKRVVLNSYRDTTGGVLVNQCRGGLCFRCFPQDHPT